MTITFPNGRLSVRLARTPAEVGQCQSLRHLCFFGSDGVDADRYDPQCLHLMVIDAEGCLVATARLRQFASGAGLAGSYAAQHYDMTGLMAQDAPMIEIGRFCIAPKALDADVLRIAWGALTGLVDRQGIKYLFGCASFQGTDPSSYGRAFARLANRHLGPMHLRPAATGGEVVALGQVSTTGQEPMPPLLRTYLAMGGWVGDHATIDRQMETMHVFTCVAVDNVPPARAKALRALAQSTALA